MQSRLAIIFLATFLGCKAKQGIVYKKGEEVIRCYTQREIPGTEDGVIREYLRCQAEKEIQWDSIYFDDELLLINKKSDQIKVELKERKRSILIESPILFYQLNQQNFKIVVKGLYEKEKLYLP